MTDAARLIVGLLCEDKGDSDDRVASKYRELSIAWTRYGYQGEIIERSTLDELLNAAAEVGVHYCFVLPVGHVLFERWRADEEASRDFFASLEAWLTSNPVALAGNYVVPGDVTGGFTTPCILVDTRRYRIWRDACRNNDVTDACRMTDRVTGWGKGLIDQCLAVGDTVEEFPDAVVAYLLDLEYHDPERRAAFASFFGRGIECFPANKSGEDELAVDDESYSLLTADQRQFLRSVAAQTANARHGVFLWNIESYDDIELPPAEFVGPITTLYSVAAGFKPQRILATHGTDEATRVVYFDYSQTALDIRRCLVEEWDGDDFPRFVEYLFQQFPAPGAYYQLWDNVTPDTVDRSDIQAMWERELKRWGGEQAFREHWQVYCRLHHEYVHSDIMQDPTPLMATVRREEQGVIWWSNAFFTMYGNWFLNANARESAYRRWISQLAELAPGLFLLGSDGNNSNVNAIRAAEYWNHYSLAGGNSLVPLHVGGTVVRM